MTGTGITTLQRILYLGALAMIMSCAPHEDAPDDEWIELFNGTDLNDWVIKISKHNLNENFANTFRVEDGLLKVNYDGYEKFDEQFGHIYYRRPFSSYHLVVEYRFAGDSIPGTPAWAYRNSGVMLHAQAPETITVEQDFPISVEMQFLAGRDDGNPRPTGNMCSPGTEVYYRGQLHQGHCLQSSAQTFPPAQWVRAEVMVYADSLVRHIIEGDTVLEYTQLLIGGGVVNGFDPAMKINGRALTSGFIALQAEGHPVEFRRVSLRGLE